MRINSISFRGVTPIIVNNPKTLDNLREHIEKNAPEVNFTLDDATHLYKGKPVYKEGLLTKACREDGKSIGFLVTGEEENKYSMMDTGWSSETAPSRHISEKIVNINEEDEKQTRRQFNMLTRRVIKDWENWDKNRGF